VANFPLHCVHSPFHSPSQEGEWPFKGQFFSLTIYRLSLDRALPTTNLGPILQALAGASG